MKQRLDASKLDAALERAARKALHGTREERSGRYMAPKAFISYSHDSPAHKEWILKLANDLRVAGVDVVLDQWDLVPGQDVSLFMQKNITEADRVVMVCSSDYVARSDKGVGGVGYERLIVTAEVVQAIDTKKFIPILRGGNPNKKLPTFLGPRLYIDFESDDDYQTKLLELARGIHGAPAIPKPPIGPNPFSATPIGTASAGNLALHKSLKDEWFEQEEKGARSGIEKLNLTGFMELRVAPLHQASKSQIELLNAVRQSEIKTFGWPIGVTLENRDEYRPRPYGDGIRAVVSIAEDRRNSFDYWAVRSNGDFYLLQSLFEDTRTLNEIFFDTRIVRVTESLMFIQNLYVKLGMPPETKVKVLVRHSGLKGRTLSSASRNRLIHWRKTTEEDESMTELSTVLGQMHETRVNETRCRDLRRGQVGSRRRKYLPHRHLDPRRRQRQHAVVHDGREDRPVALAAVVDHRRAVGIDDQVVLHAG
jgi:hypothetical protein